MEEDKKVCYCIGSVCVYSGMKCRKYEDDVKLDNEEETKKILKNKIKIKIFILISECRTSCMRYSMLLIDIKLNQNR